MDAFQIFPWSGIVDEFRLASAVPCIGKYWGNSGGTVELNSAGWKIGIICVVMTNRDVYYPIFPGIEMTTGSLAVGNGFSITAIVSSATVKVTAASFPGYVFLWK